MRAERGFTWASAYLGFLGILEKTRSYNQFGTSRNTRAAIPIDHGITVKDVFESMARAKRITASSTSIRNGILNLFTAVIGVLM